MDYYYQHGTTNYKKKKNTNYVKIYSAYFTHDIRHNKSGLCIYNNINVKGLISSKPQSLEIARETYTGKMIFTGGNIVQMPCNFNQFWRLPQYIITENLGKILAIKLDISCTQPLLTW